MCLVFVAFHKNEEYPLLIGANREESRRRPSTAPVCCRSGSLRCLLAGADHGPDGTCPRLGTWLGVNESGLVVAVTNRRDGELPPAQQTRSRGWLTVSLLGFVEPHEAARCAQEDLSQGGYGGCNLLIAGRRDAWVVQAPGPRRTSLVQLTAGVHAMTNLDLDDGYDPRIRLACETLEPDRFLDSARRICGDDRIVIGGGERGTVSSTLVLVGTSTEFHHVTGDPRGGEYELYLPFAR
jgi:uncharacterized protein with NRDE domain